MAYLGFPGGLAVKNLTANAGDAGSTAASGNPPEKEMAIHSSILAWEIPWTEESMESQRVGYVSVTKHKWPN